MPHYRFNGDVVFSPTLSENGELHFTVPIERLRSSGIPLGKDVCIQVGYQAATIEADNRTIAYDVLRGAVHNASTPDMPLRTTNERSWDWSRADALWTQEQQLQQFTQEEIADPDSILTTISDQYAPSHPAQDVIAAGQSCDGCKAFVRLWRHTRVWTSQRLMLNPASP